MGRKLIHCDTRCSLLRMRVFCIQKTIARKKQCKKRRRRGRTRRRRNRKVYEKLRTKQKNSHIDSTKTINVCSRKNSSERCHHSKSVFVLHENLKKVKKSVHRVSMNLLCRPVEYQQIPVLYRHRDLPFNRHYLRQQRQQLHPTVQQSTNILVQQPCLRITVTIQLITVSVTNSWKASRHIVCLLFSLDI